jgi:predicted dehydrogenase
MSVNRRQFMQTAAIAAAPLILPSAVFGRGRVQPSGRIGVGIIGCGIQNRFHIARLLKDEAVRIVAVCDVDTTRREDAKAKVDSGYQQEGPGGCAAFVDYHELLARKDIDAVSIATPDHWHAAMVIDAAKAGKDIYCEKPLSLNLAEAKAMVEAVRKHSRVFQTGSQQRTEFGGRFRQACEYVRSGRLGTILAVHVGIGVSSVWCDLPEEPMEPGLEWDRWLGPAPMRPYNSILSPRGVNNFYPNWRLYREYSGGMMTDFGAHMYDIMQWGLDMDASGPVQVFPPPSLPDDKAKFGARLVYANGVQAFHGGPFGVTFIGEKGSIHVDRDRLESMPDTILKEPLKPEDVHLPEAKDHHANWIECMHSRQKCICDVEVGARSVAVCHLANQAYWHRRPLNWDPQAWHFVNDTEADTWMDYQGGRRAGYELPKA